MFASFDLWASLPLFAVIFLTAGVIKGTLGIGLPTVAVGLMSQFFPPHLAIALVVFPLLTTNLWQALRERVGLDTVKTYWRLMAALSVSLWITTFFVVQTSPDVLLGVIGFVIAVFAITSLVKSTPELPERFDSLGQIVAGITAGILGGLTSIWGPPLVTYLLARRVERDEFVKAAGLFLFVGGLPLMVGFWQAGLFRGEAAQVSAVMVIPAVLGFTIGEAVRRRMSAENFRTALLWMFLLMGLNLLRRAFFG